MRKSAVWPRSLLSQIWTAWIGSSEYLGHVKLVPGKLYQTNSIEKLRFCYLPPPWLFLEGRCSPCRIAGIVKKNGSRSDTASHFFQRQAWKLFCYRQCYGISFIFGSWSAGKLWACMCKRHIQETSPLASPPWLLGNIIESIVTALHSPSPYIQ